MLVTNGIAQSLNTIAVKILADITPEASFHFAKEQLGLESLVEHEEINGRDFTDMDLAPLGMGQFTRGVTVREMATAYATFPNGGVYRKARTYTRVEDAEGNVIIDNTQDSHEAMDAHAAWYMVYMLEYACTNGTGADARFGGVRVAGKTGTTTSNRDRWFSGFTPRYTASVWCGYDKPEEIKLVVNRNPSVTMWKAVMSRLVEGMSEEEIGDFNRPTDESFVSVDVCSQTGLLAGSKCSPRSIKLFASDVPQETCEAHLEFEFTMC
jgi:penicillin-binding protein 1A